MATKPMSWHYRIVKIGDRYAIYEFYEFGDARMWTENPIAAESETRRGVIEQLEMMLADAKKYRTFIPKDEL